MKKAIWLILIALLLGCGPSTTETQPAASTDEEENAPSNSGNVETDEAESSVSVDTLSAADFDSFVPVTVVEEAAVLRAQDWQIGATDPIVVLIEYGDFQ